MKILVGIILLVHAFIHLLGFFKAFQIGKIRQLQLEISKPLGFLWLFCTLLFLYVLYLYFLDKSWWPFFALAAVIISQSLIILAWHDAKYGSVLNLVILLISLPALGSFYFQKKTEKEVTRLVQLDETSTEVSAELEENTQLPEIVRKWLRNSGVRDNPEVAFVRLRQQGRMKIKPDADWMPFQAIQYFNVKAHSFIWTARVNSGSPVYFDGRDKLINGEGEMLIKLLSLFPVVNEYNNDKIDSGAMQRFLAEICWFPTAALSNQISWEALNGNAARADLEIYGKKVSGIFNFSEDGELLSFQAERFYGGEQDAKEETWHIEMLDFKEFSGYRIPNKCRITWKLAEGDFTWLELEIMEVDYNSGEFYPN
ncbi:DUF6544 family protein [Salegentibacter flavus]|uniref:Uncharacterized protein n=1 Tax=Salegentibacter flavus TaxID=287099 RepID=A0A1I4XW55_9FLAO|nr:DUF6544 family protein [Salegentibacter flavus]SFN30007.1 hypothetical protein SAMN05660413_00399 [Salegentibacter flavus]